jgi:hypothetical protein
MLTALQYADATLSAWAWPISRLRTFLCNATDARFSFLAACFSFLAACAAERFSFHEPRRGLVAVEEVRELLLPARAERRAAVAAAEVDTDEAVDPTDDASEPKLCSVDDIDAVAPPRSV